MSMNKKKFAVFYMISITEEINVLFSKLNYGTFSFVITSK